MPEVTHRPPTPVPRPAPSACHGAHVFLLPRDELPPAGTALSRPEGSSESPAGAARAGVSPVLTAHGGAGGAAASGGRGGRDTSGSERGRPLPLPATRRVRRRRPACAGPWPHGSPPSPTTPMVLCG